MRHILFGLSSFFPEHRAGTETYVLNLTKELLKLNYHVSIVIPAVGKESYRYEYEGIIVHAFSVPQKVNTRELNGLIEPSGINEFKNILLKIKPDIFHLHSLSRSLHAKHLKIASELGIKTVFTAHLGSTFCANGSLLYKQVIQCNGEVKKQKCLSCFIDKNRRIGPILNDTIAWGINKLLFNSPVKNKFPSFHIVENKLLQLETLKKYSDINIAIAPWLERVFEINGFSKLALVKQGISSHFINHDLLQKKEHERPINLIFVGRMHPDKGFYLLMDTLKNFSTKMFNLIVVTLPFADEMDYYKEMKLKYEKLNYDQWFENLSQTDVAKKIEEADMLVLTSKYEAAPLVILEAFAKGVPVLGSNHIAISDMVKPNFNGLLFKNGDVNSLKEQLHRIIDKPDLLSKLSKNIETPRTFKDVADDMDKVYEKIL